MKAIAYFGQNCGFLHTKDAKLSTSIFKVEDYGKFWIMNVFFHIFLNIILMEGMQKLYLNSSKIIGWSWML